MIENSIKTDKNSINIEEVAEIQSDTAEKTVELNEDKMETKGLKLKRTTKEKLNEIQSRFGDAETMIASLIDQYYTFNVSVDNKYSDRKAEIEKFNYFMDSIKNSYISSLEMVTFTENKFEELFKAKLMAKDEIIKNLEDDRNSLTTKIKKCEKDIIEKDNIIKEVKESYSRLNNAMITVEKELSDKSEIISNAQNHITSLTNIAEENKRFKTSDEEKSLIIEDLKIRLEKNNYLQIKLESLTESYSILEKENRQLKEEINKSNLYIKELNGTIQSIMADKNEIITNLSKEKEIEVRKLQSEMNQLIINHNKEINQMNNKMIEMIMKNDK